jgi:signal transduction histidine kinase
MLKTEFIEVLSLVSKKLYESATEVMRTASRLIPANTFCIANLDSISTTVLTAFNREGIILTEGLVVANEESYCALVTEKSQGPLLINDNMTHPLTKDMPATQFVGGCSFLGVPIYTSEGEFYGSLCAFDNKYYQFQESDVELLLSLSTFYTTFLEMEESVQQLQLAEEKSMKILEEKSNLLAVLSHEIRTPMNGIMGMTSLLQSGGELTPEQVTYLDVIETCSVSLLAILNQILDYSRMEAGKMELESVPFDIRVCVEQVLQLFTEPVVEKGIALTSHIDIPAAGIFEGDYNKLRQILLNLIGNAIKFTDRGGVSVSVRLVSLEQETGLAQVEFAIRDTGIGIPEDGKSRLFQSFSQLRDPVSTHKYGGVGLGLSICKQLTELIGGEIWLAESNENGTCFAFTVPLTIRGAS